MAKNRTRSALAGPIERYGLIHSYPFPSRWSRYEYDTGSCRFAPVRRFVLVRPKKTEKEPKDRKGLLSFLIVLMTDR